MADLFEQTQKEPGPAVGESATEDTSNVSFEEALKQLEGAVEQLEDGSLSLSDALKLFEDGLKASNVCRARLEEAKQKVEALVTRNGGEFRLREVDLGEG